MLSELSNELADVIAAVAPSVVQVHGRRRPASGVVYSEEVVVTMMSALGRDDNLRVRRHDGQTLEAELAGWDPATALAVLRVPGLAGARLPPSAEPPRVGHLGVALARSWSNAVTASVGLVSVIGGPLPTGRRRAIDQVIRTTAPMHDGFAGGAFVDASGALLGVTTAAEIRGLGVVVPAPIAWAAAAAVLERGGRGRGYVGIAGQAVALASPQRDALGGGRDEALLVVGLTADGPAARAGVLVGDVIVAFDGEPVEAPEDLLDLLNGASVGRRVPLRMLRGEAVREVTVTVGERPREHAR